MVRQRIRILMALITIPSIAILGRLWSIQVDLTSHTEYRLEAERISVQLVPPLRGRILDRRGEEIAGNEARFDLEFVYRELNPRARTIRSICRILAQSGGFAPAREVEDKLRSFVDVTRLDSANSRAAALSSELVLLVSGIEGDEARRIAAVLDEARQRFTDAAQPPFELLPRKIDAVSRSGDSGTREVHDLWVRPSAAMRMERTLLSLARRLDGVSYDELLARVKDRIDWIEKRIEAALERLRTTGTSVVQLSRRERNDRSLYHERRWPLLSDVPLDVVSEIEYHPERYPGLEVVDSTRRHYALREAAAALVGYLRPLGEEDIEKLRESHRLLDDPSLTHLRSEGAFRVLREGGLCRNDLQPSGGLEASYDALLRGKYGMRLVRVDSRNRPRGLVGSVPSEPGSDLTTTVDANLQRLLYARLQRASRPYGLALGGSIAVMELPSGGLLATVGFPSFDPARLSSESGYYESLLARWGRHGGCFLDRPRMQALYPGSVFKVISAIAALESGKPWQGDVHPRRSYPCSRVYPYSSALHCTSRYGHYVPDKRLDLVEALKFSCNAYFYHLGHRHLTPEILTSWAAGFGFGDETGVDLPPSRLACGRVANPENVRGFVGRCHLAIGQTYIQATPLQVLRAVAAIGLRGHALPRPHVRAGGGGSDPLPPIRDATIDAVRDGMVGAASETGGTAADPELGLRRYRVAVKTGTAQYRDEGRSYHAWIAGFAPPENPRVAFVVVLERTPEHGGPACAPIAAAILEYLAREDGGLLAGGAPTVRAGGQ